MSNQKAKGPLLPGLGGKDPQLGHLPADVQKQIADLQAVLEKAVGYQKTGKIEEARNIYKGVLAKNPNQADALNLLGVLEFNNGNQEQGLELLKHAAFARPRDPIILNNMGHSLSRANRNEDAAEFLQRAVAIDPGFIEALNNLGAAFRMLGRPDDSLLCYDTLIEKYPERASGYVGKARILHDQGNLDEAEACIRRGIELSPDSITCFAALAQVKKFKEVDDDVKKMREFADADSGKAAKNKHFLFSIGKIHDDLKLYDEAFKYFERANALVTADYDLKAFEKQVDELIEVYSKEFFEERKDYGNSSKRPIFIVAMPRSGTTLLEQILSSHPQVHGAGELELVGKVSKSSPEFCNLPPRHSINYPRNMPSLTKLGSDLLARRYLWDLKRYSTDADFVTDKMPHNFMNLGLLALLFPNATLIHARRNPMDNCLSIFMQSFNDAHAYKKDLTSLGTYYKQYLRLMDHWKKVLPGRIYDAPYEEMVADQENRTRELLEHIGLPWHDDCLQYHKADRSVLTASRWQVRQPIYKRSVERWRNYEQQLQPLVDALGIES